MVTFANNNHRLETAQHDWIFHTTSHFYRNKIKKEYTGEKQDIICVNLDTPYWILEFNSPYAS